MKRVIGIGNALTDMLVNLESDSVLRKYLLEKGSMSLVNSKLQTEISKSVAGLPYSLSLGGSAGNTIRAMARLGCETGFIGKVGPDTTGDFFEQALANLGVKPFIFRGSERSGKCVALISPDGERTMITHLGAALELTAADVRADIFEGFDCVYIEGYLVQNHELIEHTARTAKERGLQVAIDLASFNIVKENLDFLRALVEKYVDIVFANEDEAIAFTGENEPINALQAISQLCELAIVKIGIRGALIKHRSEVVHVGIMAAARRVDTTGAGDFYAAGFLYGMCGTLYFDDVALQITRQGCTPLLIMGLVFFFSGLGFKISLVPFHFWTADTYQGAPTTVTGYLSVISKGAAAFTLLSILYHVFGTMIMYWQVLVMIVVVLSITIANLFAIRQDELKRFMAFSSISQAGYIMLAAVGTSWQMSASALAYYVLIYVVANMAVFTIISVVEQNNGGKTQISDYDGFYTTNPKLSFLMTLALFSLGGIPPFAGMFSKFFIFMAGVKGHDVSTTMGAWAYAVVFIALVNTVISLYYYLKYLKNRKPIHTSPASKVSGGPEA